MIVTVEMALVDLLDAFASNEPVPGGGSAAALAGAVGASLLIMVAGLPKTRTGAPEEAADLAEAAARLRPLRDTLASLDRARQRRLRRRHRGDAAAEGDRAEKQQRRAAIEAAMREATEVPLDTMRACQQALRGAVVVANSGNPNASTDTGTASAAADGGTARSRVERRRQPEERVRRRVRETRDGGAGSTDGRRRADATIALGAADTAGGRRREGFHRERQIDRIEEARKQLDRLVYDASATVRGPCRVTTMSSGATGTSNSSAIWAICLRDLPSACLPPNRINCCAWSLTWKCRHAAIPACPIAFKMTTTIAVVKMVLIMQPLDRS